MKICTIIGARPQFIKAAVVSRAFKKYNKTVREVIVHTGQHYDYEMNQVFFDQLEIPNPDYHLAVGSGLQGEQMAAMLVGVEKVLIKEKPDAVLVYGDTNSTIAGAIAASKLHVPIAHVEAGLRSFNRRMPEEINRVVVDTLSTVLFAPTHTGVNNLAKEGITKGVYLVEDVMEECLFTYLPLAKERSGILKALDLKKRNYVLVTVHRAENTNDITRLVKIVNIINKISREITVVFPMHPRTRKILTQNGTDTSFSTSVKIIDPVPYVDILQLEAHARVILTDSGGMQKEAMWLGVPCITMRDETEWVETVASGWNVVAGVDEGKIIETFDKYNQESSTKLLTVHSARMGAGLQIVEAISNRFGAPNID